MEKTRFIIYIPAIRSNDFFYRLSEFQRSALPNNLSDSHLSVAAAVSSAVGNCVAGQMDLHRPRLLTSMMVAWLLGFLHSFHCRTIGCHLQFDKFLHNSPIGYVIRDLGPLSAPKNGGKVPILTKNLKVPDTTKNQTGLDCPWPYIGNW